MTRSAVLIFGAHASRRWLLLSTATLTLAACAPLTKPPGPMCLKTAQVVAENPDRPYSVMARHPAAGSAAYSTAMATRAAAAPRPPLLRSLRRLATQNPAAAPQPAGQRRRLDINVLVLSGGAEWGAYGSGFLNGLYGGGAAPQPPGQAPELALGDYNYITGVSTGGLMTPVVWSAVVLDRKQEHQQALSALSSLKQFYSHSDDELFTAKNPLLSVLGSNGLLDPKGKLENVVRQALNQSAPALADRGDTEADVGAVDLKDGMFYTYHLTEELAQPDPLKTDCLVETLLASSAIPLSFPPRFIDSQPFVDGGVRFLAYLDRVMVNLDDLGHGESEMGAERLDIHFNVRVIVNGNQSPNDPGGLGAAQAAACDDVTDPGHDAHCPAVANTLLGSFLGGSDGKGLVLRVTQDVMVHQVKVDSVYKLYHDWRNLGLPGTFKYTYVSNGELAAPPDGAKVDGGVCQPSPKGLHFDPTFQACLFEIGRAKGAARDWTFQDLQ